MTLKTNEERKLKMKLSTKAGRSMLVPRSMDGVVNVLLRDDDGAGGDDGDDFQNQVTTSSGWQPVLIVIECRSVR